MKKIVLLTLAMVALFGTTQANDFDFSAFAPSGQTLFYNIVAGEAHVTYAQEHYYNYRTYYYWGYDAPESDLTIPDSVYNRFDGITYRVTAIGDHAFYGCDGLTSVFIPNSVTQIGLEAFRGCSELTTINIPNSVTSIGDYAFSGCTSLTSVSLPNSVTNIGYWVFNGCSSIQSPIYTNTYFVYMPPSFTGSYIIPNGITTICARAFESCEGMTSVTIPNTVTMIDEYAFSSCSRLPSITLPSAITYISSYVFSGCSQLTSVVIPNAVTKIEDGAFSGCLRLTAVSLGENLIDIGYQAFYNCGIIGELVIPQSVTQIGQEGFYGCYGINEITCLGRVAPMLGWQAFEGVNNDITINIPCGTTNLYAGRWPQFHEFQEMPFLFNAISENINQGTVTVEQEPTCDYPYATVRATAKEGYHFDHWSDGSTANPYSYTATGSVTLIGYFSGNAGIENTEVDGIKVAVVDGRIVISGADKKTVKIFDMMGRIVATTTTEETVIMPHNGVYLVKVGESTAKKVIVIR